MRLSRIIIFDAAVAPQNIEFFVGNLKNGDTPLILDPSSLKHELKLPSSTHRDVGKKSKETNRSNFKVDEIEIISPRDAYLSKDYVAAYSNIKPHDDIEDVTIAAHDQNIIFPRKVFDSKQNKKFDLNNDSSRGFYTSDDCEKPLESKTVLLQSDDSETQGPALLRMNSFEIDAESNYEIYDIYNKFSQFKHSISVESDIKRKKSEYHRLCSDSETSEYEGDDCKESEDPDDWWYNDSMEVSQRQKAPVESEYIIADSMNEQSLFDKSVTKESEEEILRRNFFASDSSYNFGGCL